MPTTVESLQVNFDGQFAAAAAAGAVAASNVANAIDKVGQSSDTTDAKIQQSTRSWTSWAKVVDPAAASAAKVEAANRNAVAQIAALGQAMAQGTVSASAYQAQMQNIANRQAALTDSANKAAARMTIQTPQVSVATNFIDQDALDRAADSVDKLRAEFVPLAAAQQQAAAAQDRISLGLKTGALSSDEAAAALATVKSRYDAVASAASSTTPELKNLGSAHQSATDAAKLQGYQLVELGEIAHKFGDSMLSGGSAVKSLAYEVPNAVGVLGGFGNALKFITSPAALVVEGIVAVVGSMAALAIGAETQERALANLQAQLSVTRADYASLGTTITQSQSRIAAASGISTPDAKAAATTIASQVNFSGTESDLQDLVTLSAQVSKAFGIDVPAAAQKLAQGFKDPSAAAKQLVDQGFQGISSATLVSIQRLQAQGNSIQASKLLFDAYRSSLGSVASSMTPFQKALLALDQAFNGADKSGHSFGQDLGDYVTAAATKAVNALTSVVNGIKAARDAVNSSTNSVATGVGYTNAGKIDFKSALAYQESGNNPTKQNAEGYVGLYQQGSGRLTDLGLYTPAKGEDPNSNAFTGTFNIPGFDAVKTVQDFKTNALAQQAAMDAELKQTDAAIAAMGAAAAGFNKQGLEAVAHLGGIGGMQNFVRSGGQMNPADNNKTSLADYYRAYSPEGTVIPSSIPQYGAANAIKPGGGRKFGMLSNADVSAQQQAARDNANLTQGVQDSSGTLYARQKANQDALTEASGQLDIAKQNGDQDAVARLTQRVKDLTGAQSDLITEQAKASRAALDAVVPLQAQEGAQRSVAEATQQMNEIDRQTGTTDPAARNALISATLQRLSSDYKDTVAAADLANAAQLRINAAYANGAKSVSDATNAVKAQDLARKDFQPGPAQDAAAANYARTLNIGTAANVDAQTLGRGLDQQNQLAQIKQQSDDIGANTDVAAKNLAVLQERQNIIRAGGNIDSAASQQSLANTAAISDATAALQKQQAVMSDFRELASSIGSTLTSALTTPFAAGETAAQRLQSTFSTVFQAIASELTKLGLVNPVLNALTGTSNPTLSTAGGLLGKLGSSLFGSSATTTAATTATSSLGSIGSLGSLTGAVIQHGGGIYGNDNFPTRYVPMSVFAGAPRMHDGGIANDEYAAILQKGEGVFTQAQMAAMGGGGSGQAQTSGSGGDLHVHFNIDAKGAGPREIEVLKSQIPSIAISAVQGASGRGGTFTKTVRGGR